MEKPKVDVVKLFDDSKLSSRGYLNISAPMVRYSKLEFRTLLRRYNVDLSYTPMIVADSFCVSNDARQNEFSSNADDGPLIAQFAAKDAVDLLTATELIYPYVDGVDLNCGCPQKWAITAGYGCALLRNPELLHDMIRTVKRNLPTAFSCSLKLRILDSDLQTTVDLCRKLEMCGVTFLAVHGRRPWQKSSEPVDIDAFVDIKKSLRVPFVINGDIKSAKDAELCHKLTNCDGVMVARGLLANPTLFTGTSSTPFECIREWINLAHTAKDRLSFQNFHHHLAFMMEKMMKKRLRVEMNNLTTKSQVLQFLDDNFHVIGELDESLAYMECCYDENLYKNRKKESDIHTYNQLKSAQNQNGRFFDDFQKTSDTDDLGQFDFMGSSIFDE